MWVKTETGQEEEDPLSIVRPAVHGVILNGKAEYAANPERLRENMADDRDPEEDLASFTATAERLGLKGKERSRYIHEHMTGVGYKAEPRYVTSDDDEDEEDDGGRFSVRRRSGSRNRDSSSGRSGSRQRNSGSGWYDD